MQSVNKFRALAAITLSLTLAATAASGLRAQEPDAPSDAMALAPLGRLESDVELQVFPTDISPRYRETLTAGTVVRVGEESRGFRKVFLPIGTRGFVHSDFTTPVDDDGVVRATKSVSYRFQPQAGQAPVEIVKADTAFHVVGVDGEWWVVRYPQSAAWVPASSVVIFDGAGESNPTLTAAWDALDARHRGESLEWITATRAADAEAAMIKEREAKLDALRKSFRATGALPLEQRDYTTVKTETEAFLAALGAPVDAAADVGSAGTTGDADPTADEGAEADPEAVDPKETKEPAKVDPFVVRVQRFRERVETEITIVDATRFVGEAPKTSNVVGDGANGSPRRVLDPAARFDAIGWLEWEESLGGTSTIRLMKGRQVLHDLICSSGRYDLRMFHGLEVGLMGPKARPSVESIRLLDVEKIEVLHARVRR